MAVPETGTNVYLNGALVKNTNFLQNSIFIQNLTPGTYAVMAEKEGYWPWAKKLTVAESAVAEAKVLMIPQEIKGDILLKGQFESIYASDKDSLLILEEKKGESYVLTLYLPQKKEFLTPSGSASKKLLTNHKKLKAVLWAAGSADIFYDNKSVSLSFDFDKRSVSAKNTALKIDETLSALPHKISLDFLQKTKMWHNDKNVWIEWISDSPLPYYLSSPQELIFQTKSSIKNAAFFPKRSDLALVSVGNGVFVSEIDSRGARNFQPIYKGKDPNFAVLNNEIYVLDQEVLAKMEL